MATQTIIDGGKQAITFNNDTEPCAVYVDGELQQNVSFVPQTVQGAGVVSYASEYKKNHIEIDIEGTTEQGTFAGNVIDALNLTSYSSTEEDYTISYYARILRSTQPIILPTTDSANITVTLINTENITSQIPNYETLFLINQSKDVLFTLFAGGAPVVNQTIPTNDTYYLAIADEEDAGNDNARCYNLFVQNAKLQVEYYGTITTPTPQTPIPIENANNEGMSVVLHGDNLFNQDELLTDSDFTKAEYNGVECIKVVPDAYIYRFPLSNSIPSGTKISSSCDVAHPLTKGDFYIQAYYEDGTNTTIVRQMSDVVENFTHIEGSIVVSKNMTALQFSFFSRFSYRPYYFKNFMLNIGNPKPYEPYFREENTIPASVNDIPLSFAGESNITDKLVVDRINNKVEYIQKFTQYQMQGDEVISGTATTTNGNTEATFILPSPLPDDSKYLLQWCNCAQNMAVATSSDRNLFEVFEGNGYCLARFKFLNCASEADMRNIFIDKVNSGEPVTVQYVLVTPISHTLSGTTFGQSLLNLATENQTNYFEVQGNVPEIPLKITYAKWGGNLENNSNT